MKKPELAWLKDLGEKLRPLAHRYRAVLIVLLAGMLLLASGGWFGGGEEQAAAQTAYTTARWRHALALGSSCLSACSVRPQIMPYRSC